MQLASQQHPSAAGNAAGHNGLPAGHDVARRSPFADAGAAGPPELRTPFEAARSKPSLEGAGNGGSLATELQARAKPGTSAL